MRVVELCKHMLIIPALRRQKNPEFKARLGLPLIGKPCQKK
jgi:hypothetical protein